MLLVIVILLDASKNEPSFSECIEPLSFNPVLLIVDGLGNFLARSP
jgi:hypothetical protein